MKKFLYQVIKFSIILILISYVFVWFYEKPQREAYHSGTSVKLLKWNSIKNNPNKYDLIILGTSRGYCAYNPMVIDSTIKMSSYNMCTGSQHIIESLYMFKEILKHQKPKYLVYDVFLPSFRKSPDYSQVFSNSKYMSNDMILNEFFNSKFLDFLFPIVKYKSSLKRDIVGLFKFKKTHTIDTISWIKGYKPSTKENDSIAVKNFGSIYTFSNTDVFSNNEIEYYLKALKKLCDNHEVELICIRTPYPPTRLKNTLKDDANIYFTEFLNSQEISFYDLNYLSNNNYTDYDFVDYHHMNSIGAKKASIDLAEILNARTHNNVYIK